MKELAYKTEWNKKYYKLKITTWSKENKILSALENNIIKIMIKAPPIKWKANKELIKFLWELLNVKKDKIIINSWIKEQIKIIIVDFS